MIRKFKSTINGTNVVPLYTHNIVMEREPSLVVNRMYYIDDDVV